MFREKDKMVYQNTKAPDELKNRVWLSVEQHRKRAKRQHMTFVVAAACFAIVFSLNGVFDSNSSILSVNDTTVSYDAVKLHSSARGGLLTASEGHNFDPVFFIPLEINVTEKAHIEVSKGTLQQVETDDSSEEVKAMDISEKTVIYWCVSGDTDSASTCIITTDEEEYIYVIEFDEEKSVFIIKQTK